MNHVLTVSFSSNKAKVRDFCLKKGERESIQSTGKNRESEKDEKKGQVK